MRPLYVSIAELRAEGLTTVEMDDERVLNLIERMSSKIDLFTGQFFIPKTEVVRVDGKELPYVSYPRSVPIIKINSVQIIPENCRVKRWNCVFPRQAIETLPLRTDQYAISGSKREVEFLDYSKNYHMHDDYYFSIGERFPKVFPEGSSNVELNGVFGWVENPKEVESLVTVDSLSTDNFLQVADASLFEKYDHLIIELTPALQRRVTRIDYDNNILYVDVLGRTVQTGTIIRSYGSVPLQIAECAMRLVNRYRSLLFDPENQDDINGAIHEEKIDSYQWKAKARFYGGLWDKEETNWASTGDLIVDRILQEFVGPVEVGIV
jgi:hypothetical protein